MFTQPFIPDHDAIFDAIMDAQVAAVAREEASPLIDAWVSECATIDAADETIGVEVPFWLLVAPGTFVVGTLDRIARDADGVFGCEWKSTAKRSPARGAFAGWNPERWYDEIKSSHQIGTYAAALQSGTFIGLPATSFPYATAPVRILVRAVSKSSPPEVWPTARGAFVEVSQQKITNTLNAYRVVAEQQRAAARSGLVPWQLPGHHCMKFNKFKCPHYEPCRTDAVPPTSRALTVGSFSPGSQKAVEAIIRMSAGNDKNAIDNGDDSIVILSASTMSDFQQCPEKWRRSAAGHSEDASEAQETGTVLHSALSALYEQMMGRK